MEITGNHQEDTAGDYFLKVGGTIVILSGLAVYYHEGRKNSMVPTV